MIAKYGATKLIDFGVACPTQTNLHTAEGHIDGTLHYISPEQMEGGETDNRSDIYSFGTILYEMLTGAKTFPQESIAELLKQKTAHKFKSPHDYGTPVSVDLANIIHRCLKSAPTKRYQNTQELTESLKKLYESLTTQTPEDVLKNYFSGNENLIHTISSKTKTRRFIDKLKTLWPWGKSKTPKPLDKPKLLGISDKPKTEDANSNEIKTLWFLDKLKTLWALGRSKTPKPSNKPKISDKPKTPELLEKPKNETGHTRNTIAVGKNTTPLKSSHKKQRVNTSDGKNKRKKK
jgi:serine/threonine protein kinase